MGTTSRAGPLEDEVWREARRLWGDKLTPILPNLVGSHVSDSTRSFLTHVGLPTECPLPFTFYHDERLLRPLSMVDADYLVFGDNYGVMFAVKAGTDELRSVYPDEKRPQRFMNSHISLFFTFLGLLASRLQELRQASSGHVDIVVHELRRQFLSRDARALEDAHSWWNLLLEQAIEGFV